MGTGGDPVWPVELRLNPAKDTLIIAFEDGALRVEAVWHLEVGKATRLPDATLDDETLGLLASGDLEAALKRGIRSGGAPTTS